jgi:S-adenosylmethionine synthetase
MKPSAIIDRFGLKNPIFLKTATYGHFGRDIKNEEVEFNSNGKSFKKEVEFFAWEKLDYIEKIKKEFGI